MGKSRFEAASDGVFAIAVTLLVLGLSVPVLRRPTDETLASALLNLRLNFVAYALSFAVIGIMWNNHQMLFRTVVKLDRTTWLLNLLLLGITAFIPFSTAVLGSYPLLRPADLLYGLTLTAASITYNALLHYLIAHNAFSAAINRSAITQTVFHYRVGLVVYLAATLISFAAPAAKLRAVLRDNGVLLVPARCGFGHSDRCYRQSLSVQRNTRDELRDLIVILNA